jgi:ubiquinone/menaquinone biosynthesis C-methylase UbiE
MQKSDFEDLDKLESIHWWFKGMREISKRILSRFITSSESALDAGCGVGGNLSWLEHYAPRDKIFGIDVDSDAVSFISPRYKERVQIASVTQLPFADNSFDLVTSFDVMVQVPGEDGEKAGIREMYRVLKPGGCLYIRCAAYPWLFSDHDRSLHTQRRYTVSSLKKVLEEGGLTLLYSTYANFFLLPVAILSRLFLKPLGLVNAGSDVKAAPQLVNQIFYTLLKLEAFLLSFGVSFPAGLSVIIVAKKKGPALT